MAQRVDAVVTAVIGPLVRVQAGDETLVVPFRRRLQWEGSPTDRRLVVGDRVVLEERHSQVVVTAVAGRSTTLTRRSPGEARPRVIAANVDQAGLPIYRPDHRRLA